MTVRENVTVFLFNKAVALDTEYDYNTYDSLDYGVPLRGNLKNFLCYFNLDSEFKQIFILVICTSSVTWEVGVFTRVYPTFSHWPQISTFSFLCAIQRLLRSTIRFKTNIATSVIHKLLA